MGKNERDKAVIDWIESLRSGQVRFIEQCEYCDMAYHPMPRYQKGNKMIFVCFDDECQEKALADGYIYRDDLTPSR